MVHNPYISRFKMALKRTSLVVVWLDVRQRYSEGQQKLTNLLVWELDIFRLNRP